MIKNLHSVLVLIFSFFCASFVGATSLTVSMSTVEMVACNGEATGSITVSATGGMTGTYTYNWSNGMSGATLSGLAANTYSVTVSDANSCTGTETITVTEPPLITTGIGSFNNASCNSNADGWATISATGGNGGYTYAWSHGPVGQTATELSAGTYIVTVSDQNGCSTTQSVTISENPPISTGFLNFANVSCFGGNDGMATASAAAGSGSYNYAWSNGQFGLTATGLPAGTHYVTITDAVNCTAVDSIVISEATEIQFSLTTATEESTPGANDASLLVDVWGGVMPYNYMWQVNGTTVSTVEDPTGLANGDYTLIVTDANGCQFTSQVINLGMATNTQDLRLAEFISLAPNPSVGEVNLTLELPPQERVTIEVVSLTGQKVHQETATIQNKNFLLDMNNQANGLYLVRIIVADRAITKKFVLER